MLVAAASTVNVDEVLLALKISFLVILYLFIWRIVRTASKDLRLPQESFVLTPEGARERRRKASGRLVVLKSPALNAGHSIGIDSAAIAVGRGGQNDVAIEHDEFASSNHARFTPQRDGLWIEDIGSTNGTFVNGEKLPEPRRLVPGDVVTIGETELRYEL
jgi:pSer/pThr/pTyr-binding forkhead associated (FHA) protein